MKTQLTEQKSLDIENRLLRDMAWRYARLIQIGKEKADMKAQEAAKRAESRKPETVRIMMTKNGQLSHQRNGLILDAHVGECRGRTIYWIHWAGNLLAVDEADCVRLDGKKTPK